MRVTIGQLTEDLTPFTKQGDEAMNVEIVPRKIVEDIIEMCLELGERNYDAGMKCDGRVNPKTQSNYFARSKAYENIAQLAHELLEKFEGEDDERNDHNR